MQRAPQNASSAFPLKHTQPWCLASSQTSVDFGKPCSSSCCRCTRACGGAEGEDWLLCAAAVCPLCSQVRVEGQDRTQKQLWIKYCNTLTKWVNEYISRQYYMQGFYWKCIGLCSNTVQYCNSLIKWVNEKISRQKYMQGFIESVLVCLASRCVYVLNKQIKNQMIFCNIQKFHSPLINLKTTLLCA